LFYNHLATRTFLISFTFDDVLPCIITVKRLPSCLQGGLKRCKNIMAQPKLHWNLMH